MAVALLVFGVVTGITCTDAILSAVQEEAAVVQLAQQLVAHEAVVAETNRCGAGGAGLGSRPLGAGV